MNPKYIEQSKSVSIKVLRGLFPEIKSTDELIAHLTSVEMVDLSSQHLTTVDGLDMLSELKSVQLQNNMINDFPQIVIDLLPNLVSINLSNNRLTDLPDLSHSRIEELNVSYNPIENINVDKLPGSLR